MTNLRLTVYLMTTAWILCAFAALAQGPVGERGKALQQRRHAGSRPARGAASRPARSTAPAKWILDPVQGENLHFKTFTSAAAGQEVSYLIYIPAEYETSGHKRYPVMYWLHGIGGVQTGLPPLVNRINEAVLAGKCPPMLAVFVNGMKDSFFCDSTDGKTPVESMIIRDLIPHIDQTYRTIASREGRLIEGFSMGGFGAGHLGFKYPELFGSVSIIDGALLDVGSIKGRHADLFQRIFGGQEENFIAAMPQTLVEKNADELRGKTVIRQAVGALVQNNESLHERLVELNISSDYDVIEGAGHSHPNVYGGLGEKNWEFYRKALGGTGEAASAPAGQ